MMMMKLTFGVGPYILIDVYSVLLRLQTPVIDVAIGRTVVCGFPAFAQYVTFGIISTDVCVGRESHSAWKRHRG
jgi:hypothetical protein